MIIYLCEMTREEILLLHTVRWRKASLYAAGTGQISSQVKTSSQSHPVSSESAKPPLLLVPYIHDSLSGGKEQSLERLVSSAAVRLGQLELAVRGLSSSMFRGGARVCRLLKQDLHTRLGSNNCWLGTGIF